MFRNPLAQLVLDSILIPAVFLLRFCRWAGWTGVNLMFSRWNLFARLDSIDRKLSHVQFLLERVMATQAELATQLTATKDKLVKIGAETTSLLTKIQELLGQIANAQVTPELQAAADALKAQADVVDNLVDDLPTG